MHPNVPVRNVLLVEDQTAIRQMMATLIAYMPGFRVIAEEYRKPGLALSSATVQDKQALWQQFLAWAQQEQLDPSTFQAAKKDSNALARFLAAQPSDIIGRIVIPADIAEILLRRS
jgi:hypothetical protein